MKNNEVLLAQIYGYSKCPDDLKVKIISKRTDGHFDYICVLSNKDDGWIEVGYTGSYSARYIIDDWILEK